MDEAEKDERDDEAGAEVVDIDELDGRLEAEALTSDTLTPGADAEAEPYHALMVVDAEGRTTGQLWTFGGKMMLFGSEEVAQKVLGALEGGEIRWALRGVTARHLEALELISEGQGVELYVVRGLTPAGKVEAVPLKVDLPLRKGTRPPPLPPPRG